MAQTDAPQADAFHRRAEEHQAPIPTIDLSHRLWENRFRIFKVLVALGILGTGIYGLASDAGAISSDNAVVSARLLHLRSPIEGMVSGPALMIGDRLAKGATVATVRNDAVSHAGLASLRTDLAAARARLAGDRRMQPALASMLAGLSRHTGDYARTQTATLALQVATDASKLRAARSTQSKTAAALRRDLALVKNGFVSRASLDQARNAAQVAAAAVSAAKLTLKQDAARYVGGTQGVFVDGTGGNDIPYSAQQADMVRLRQLSLAGDIATQTARIASLKAAITHEQARIAHLATARITAPVAGTVWSVGAGDGEHVGAGAAVVDLVDCRKRMVLAAMPDSVYANVAVGETATYRYAGQSTNEHGTVVALMGMQTPLRAGDLAAFPVREPNTRTFVAVIKPAAGNAAADGGACHVGQAVSVAIPLHGGSVIRRSWLALKSRVF